MVLIWCIDHSVEEIVTQVLRLSFSLVLLFRALFAIKIMVCLGMFGTWAGIRIQQHVLRDYFHLVLFGYDNGTNPDRDPIVDQDGAW